MAAAWFLIGLGLFFIALLIILARRTGGGDRHGMHAEIGRAASQVHHHNQNIGPGV
jgi:hypothetical protein